jgi:hypothetical protein
MSISANLSLLLRIGARLLTSTVICPVDHEIHETLWGNHFSLAVMHQQLRMTWRERWEDEDTATNAALLA